MKKYKISFSLSNLFADSTSQVTTLQNKSKAIFTAMAGATYVASNAEWTLLVAVAAVVSDTLISCLSFDEV